VHGVRCALCWEFEKRRLSANYDANVLSLGERLIEKIVALEIVQFWF